MAPISQKFARGAMITVVVLACTRLLLRALLEVWRGAWGGGVFELLRQVDPLDDGADVRRALADRLHRGLGWPALVATTR